MDKDGWVSYRNGFVKGIWNQHGSDNSVLQKINNGEEKDYKTGSTF